MKKQCGSLMVIAGSVLVFVFLLFPSCDLGITETEDGLTVDMDIQYLLQNGIPPEDIECVSVLDANNLNRIAHLNNLNREQVNAFFYSFVEKHEDSEVKYVDDKLPIEAVLLMKNHDMKLAENHEPNRLKSYCSNWGAYTLTGQNNGAGWVVRSEPGYNHVSGKATLPTYDVTDNDIPYMFFGAHNTNGTMYTDAGIMYVNSTDDWRMFYSLKLNGVHYWRSDLSLPSDINQFHIIYDIENIFTSGIGNEERITLTVVGLPSWETLGTYTARTGNNYVDSDYSNLQVNRSITLAQKIENLSNDAAIAHAKWTDVYIHSPSGYSLWGCGQTSAAGKYYKPEHWGKITVHSYSKWNAEDITIYYHDW